MSLVEALRARKVLPWTAAYLGSGWVVLEALSLLSASYDWSPAVMRIAPVLLAGGLLVVILLAWFHGESGRQRPVAIEILLMTMIIASTLGTALRLARARREPPAAANAGGTAKSRVPSDVYEEFTRARLLLTRINRTDLDSATRLLEHVVARAPGFAPGHAQLAQAYSLQGSVFRAGEGDFEQKALLAAERALALDTRIPEAHSVRARMLWTRAGGYAHVAAATEFRHALVLNPKDVNAMFQLAQILMHVGLLQEAIELHERAARLSPSDPGPRVFRALSLFYLGDVARAMDVFRSAPPSFNPSFIAYHVGWGLWREGAYAGAMRRIEDALRVDSVDESGVLRSMRAMMHAQAGNRGAATGIPFSIITPRTIWASLIPSWHSRTRRYTGCRWRRTKACLATRYSRTTLT